jgi:flagellar biosynthesis anti-sigma factor FlgM
MRVNSNSFVGNEATKLGSELPARAPQTVVPEDGGFTTAASKAQGRQTAGEDVAHFTSHAGQVESLKAQVLSQPEIREAKVQSLQSAIGSGEYSVSPSQIAEALKSELATDVYG